MSTKYIIFIVHLTGLHAPQLCVLLQWETLISSTSNTLIKNQIIPVIAFSGHKNFHLHNMRQNGNLWVFDPVFRIKRQKTWKKKWGDGRCTLRETDIHVLGHQNQRVRKLSEIKQHKEKNRQNGAGCSDRWRQHLFKPWKARWPNSLREV